MVYLIVQVVHHLTRFQTSEAIACYHSIVSPPIISCQPSDEMRRVVWEFQIPSQEDLQRSLASHQSVLSSKARYPSKSLRPHS